METKRNLIQELREIVEQLPTIAFFEHKKVKIEKSIGGAWDIYTEMFSDEHVYIQLYEDYFLVTTAQLGSNYELTLKLLPIVKEAVEDYLKKQVIRDSEKLDQLLKQREELDKEIEKLK